MPRPALIALDLDGVLVDGMEEYWRSSLHVAQGFGAPWPALETQVPPDFCRIRPWVHRGWEMVVVAWALAHGATASLFLKDYRAALQHWQGDLGQSSAQLQRALEQCRQHQLHHEPLPWLAQHRFYPGVVERLQGWSREGVAWTVITTKGRDFAAALLDHQHLEPTAIHGRESGAKSKVLEHLQKEQQPVWFVEDRLPTLETVIGEPQLGNVGCYLAAWGYLRPNDQEQLGPPIHWLERHTFCAPFSTWPA